MDRPVNMNAPIRNIGTKGLNPGSLYCALWVLARRTFDACSQALSTHPRANVEYILPRFRCGFSHERIPLLQTTQLLAHYNAWVLQGLFFPPLRAAVASASKIVCRNGNPQGDIFL